MYVGICIYEHPRPLQKMQIEGFLGVNPVSMICLVEQWMCHDQLTNSHPDGFNCGLHFVEIYT